MSQEMLQILLGKIEAVELLAVRLFEFSRAAAHERIYELNNFERLHHQGSERLVSLDGRLADVEQGLRRVEDLITKIARSSDESPRFRDEIMPIARLLERIHDLTSASLANGDSHFSSMWERFEFVRREILFEMSRGTRAAAAATLSEATIRATEKVEAAKASGSIKLNLGCGHIARTEYINIDSRDLPGVDIVTDINNLPFEPNSVSEISSTHLLEHFAQETLRRDLLPSWLKLLQKGGIFHAVTPDADAMLRNFGTGSYSFEDFREVVFGAQDYIGDFHFNLFTPDSLEKMLRDAGFAQIAIPAAGRRNGRCYEFEITAIRP